MKLLCVGDSITFGYEMQSSNKWTTLVANELEVEVVNCGINGDTTSGMLSRFLKSLLEHNPSHVIILGGTNDLWFGLKDEQIISNIFTMCRQAKHHKIIPIVGIPTPYFIFNESNFIGEDYAECVRGFQNRLIDFCMLKELLFIEFGSDLRREHFMDDGLHPNEEGYKIISKTIVKRIQNM